VARTNLSATLMAGAQNHVTPLLQVEAIGIRDARQLYRTDTAALVRAGA
jgi:hypothetical protein